MRFDLGDDVPVELWGRLFCFDVVALRMTEAEEVGKSDPDNRFA